MAQWRGGANLAGKTPWWCGGAMIKKVAHVAVARSKKKWPAPSNENLLVVDDAIIRHFCEFSEYGTKDS